MHRQQRRRKSKVEASSRNKRSNREYNGNNGGLGVRGRKHQKGPLASLFEKGRFAARLLWFCVLGVCSFVWVLQQQLRKHSSRRATAMVEVIAETVTKVVGSSGSESPSGSTCAFCKGPGSKRCLACKVRGNSY